MRTRYTHTEKLPGRQKYNAIISNLTVEKKRGDRRRREMYEDGRDKKWATEGCRGNAALLSSHHRELIVSNPLTHIGGTDKHTLTLTHTHTLSI